MFDRRLMLSFLDGVITESERGNPKTLENTRKELSSVLSQMKQLGKTPTTSKKYTELKVRANQLEAKIKKLRTGQ